MKKAVVVLSGGQDSATCAAWAKERFDEIVCVTFSYKQRHRREIFSAHAIANLIGSKHLLRAVPALADLPGSALTDSSVSSRDVDPKTGLPRSFVPGRNLVFLSCAASIALAMGIETLVTGVCQTDYSGYPDCRRDTIDAMEVAIRLGNRGLCNDFRIETPLMNLTKAQTVQLAHATPYGWEAVALSWTCYEGGEIPCGACPACVLRARGFAEAGYPDPALKKS